MPGPRANADMSPTRLRAVQPAGAWGSGGKSFKDIIQTDAAEAKKKARPRSAVRRPACYAMDCSACPGMRGGQGHWVCTPGSAVLFCVWLQEQESKQHEKEAAVATAAAATAAAVVAAKKQEGAAAKQREEEAAAKREAEQRAQQEVR